MVDQDLLNSDVAKISIVISANRHLFYEKLGQEWPYRQSLVNIRDPDKESAIAYKTAMHSIFRQNPKVGQEQSPENNTTLKIYACNHHLKLIKLWRHVMWLENWYTTVGWLLFTLPYPMHVQWIWWQNEFLLTGYASSFPCKTVLRVPWSLQDKSAISAIEMYSTHCCLVLEGPCDTWYCLTSGGWLVGIKLPWQ